MLRRLPVFLNLEARLPSIWIEQPRLAARSLSTAAQLPHASGRTAFPWSIIRSRTYSTKTLGPMWQPGHHAPTPEHLLETNAKWVRDTDPQLFLTTAKGQKPSIFWLGCCDSRVPAELITGAMPGDLFVHRNIANTFHNKDTSALAALAYAVNVLGVSHVVVCGHHGCGGVQAALASAKDRTAASAVDTVDEGSQAIQQWLSPIRALAVSNIRATQSSPAGEVDAPSDASALRTLVTQNVCAQVSNVASSSVLQTAWRSGRSIAVHGWVYDIATGKLEDLKVTEGIVNES